MPRPFRFQPPSLSEHAVARAFLVEQLARRWDHRVVTIVAGPGFGKTALLAAAIAEPGGRGRRDVWLSCEPADESAGHLTAGLATAFGLAPEADFAAVLDAAWAAAPADICIVLDDVHEIPAGSEGAALVARLAVELASNGHVVMASRDTLPVPLGRLAATGQLVRLTERDLVFDETEVAAFAAAQNVDPGLLGSTGGWPALAALTASTGADLVIDYLWEEVLHRLGEEPARLLACFVAAGGGDDEVASAVAGRAASVADVVASVPLVQNASDGWAALHPLWEPALRGLLTDDEAAEARRRAASVHLERGRYGMAVDLFVEAEAWESVLAAIRRAERRPPVSAPGFAGASLRIEPVTAADFGRWYRTLPVTWRQEPDALLAAGLELQARSPVEALTLLGACADGFRDRGDVEGELAALSHAAMIRWWINDGAGLDALYARVGVLGADGSRRARAMVGVGAAALAHLRGDSAAVLAALDDVGDDVREWTPVVRWLRSVAHRRNGDLAQSHDELDRAVFAGRADPQHEIARLRAGWLEGDVDHVVARLPDLYAGYVRSGDRFLAREIGLELAGKAAWLGDVATANRLLDENAALLPDAPSVLARTLATLARAAVSIGTGDETRARAVLCDHVLVGAGAVGSPEGWYWRDRAGIALVYVLVPETRPTWATEPLGPAHRPGLALGVALAATRDGDLGPVRALEWPPAGVVRAHLPFRWVAEMAAAGNAAGNAAPDDLLRALGVHAGPLLRDVASSHPVKAVAAAAKKLAKEFPAVPPYRLRISVVGPLQLLRDGAEVRPGELRRQRARELLCYLVARPRVRREEVGETLWPDAADPGHNLRVTLDYLQRALEPERPRGSRPFFVRTVGDWLELTDDDHLEVDARELEARLDEAREAEREDALPAALEAYGAALPLWRGEPYADAPYALWAESQRVRLRVAYVAAAIRAGELWVAARAVDDALRAAQHAITADPTSEPAYRLLARAHLAKEDRSSARDALHRCAEALADLDIEPDATTAALMTSLDP